MKIGIVCNALANSGGMERYTLDIIRGFVASGHEVTVFTRKVDASLYEATLVKTVKINTSFLPKRFRDFYVSNLLPSLRKKHPLDVMWILLFAEALILVFSRQRERGKAFLTDLFFPSKKHPIKRQAA